MSYLLNLQPANDDFALETTVILVKPDLAEVQLHFESKVAARPAPLLISWRHPLINSCHCWTPAAHLDHTIRPDWHPHAFTSRSTSHAPVYTLYGMDGTNALTFALSDCLQAIRLSAGVHEESAEAACQVTLFAEPMAPLLAYSVTLRLDRRPLPYYQTLQETSAWWAGLPDYQPSPPPATSREPVYSTWYSFHQDVSAAGLETQCRLAKELGMSTLIVDDGWQTDDNSRGYAYCGDWEVTPNKLPDFQAHVERIHAIGLGYMLWFSVPAVGIHSRAYQRFRHQILDPKNTSGAHVLDPRYPDVRRYLLNTYSRFVRDCGIDGLKLDFVDSFRFPDGSVSGDEASAAPSQLIDQTRDYESVPAAVDRLLSDVIAELRQLKPDILIEFRQTYIGPLMRKYGNMLRAGDVPNDFTSNRVRTIDVRLLAGETAVHADMMMWHPEEPVENAAMQLVHTIFAVPQISVRLDQIPDEHVAMIRFYLQFWRTHRDVLLDGWLQPHRPEYLYPLVEAVAEDKRVIAFYGQIYADLTDVPTILILVNGTVESFVLLTVDPNGALPVVSRLLTIWNCCGEVVRRATVTLAPGIHRFDIPPAGVATFA
jgi:alpha-galactosidase